MKKPKAKPSCDGIEFDSKEELDFYLFCKEGVEAGFIKYFYYHEDVFELSPALTETIQKQLKTKVKEVSHTIFRPHTYKPDFMIRVLPEFNALPHGLRGGASKLIYFIDVKPAFEREHSKAEVFKVNQKWVYDKYKVFINKVIPQEFFKLTWAPSVKHKISGQPLIRYAGCKTIKDMKHE